MHNRRQQSPAKICQPLTKETPGFPVLPPRLSIPVYHPPARRHSSDKSPGSGAAQPVAGDQLRSFESFTENPPARPAAPWGGDAGNASFPRGAPTALRRPPPGRHAPPLCSWLNQGAGAAPPPAGASGARASRPMRPRGSRAAPLTGCAAPRGPLPPRPPRRRRPRLLPPVSVGASPGEQVPSPLEGISLGLSVSFASRYFPRGPTPNPAPQPARISVRDSSAAAAERAGPLRWVPAPRAGRWPSAVSLLPGFSEPRRLNLARRHRLLPSLRRAPEWTFPLRRIPSGPAWEALLFVSTLASFISGLLDALVFVSPWSPARPGSLQNKLKTEWA